MIDAIIVGGGLGGLFSAFQLREAGYEVLLIEKKRYPFHRVCGEYVSNEVIPFLEKQGLFPHDLSPAMIDKFQLTSVKGKTLNMNLDLGGFGVSRYAWDHWLIKKLRERGVVIWEGETVNHIQESAEGMEITTTCGQVADARIVIGAFGKRSVLDKSLDRPFMRRRSPYVGIKYHVRYDFPKDVVALHNFPGGYCGINKVEGDRYNLCYLTERDNLKRHGNIPDMEAAVLAQNPYLRDILRNAEFLLEQPEVINEITFEAKEPVYHGVFMVGDAAGMITPLCGNGMAMAIHGSKLLVQCIQNQGLNTENERRQLRSTYTDLWKKKFAFRLAAGRTIQKLFGGKRSSGLAVGMGKTVRPVASFLMSQTHGEPFS